MECEEVVHGGLLQSLRRRSAGFDLCTSLLLHDVGKTFRMEQSLQMQSFGEDRDESSETSAEQENHDHQAAEA